MRVPQRFNSDLTIVTVRGEIIGLRDMYAIDSKPVRERTPRIPEVLAEPSVSSWQVAQGYARQNAARLLSNPVVWFSDPMHALKFIMAANQAKNTYKLEGNKKMNGVAVNGVGFKEQGAASDRVFGSLPGSPVSSGRLWIDPATGAIHMTELWVESETDSARVQVSYTPDPKLSLLVPKEASGTFETREKGTGMSGRGGSNTSRWAFESNVKYSNVRYAALDLSRLR
jgi:hypothetical protein